MQKKLGTIIQLKLDNEHELFVGEGHILCMSSKLAEVFRGSTPTLQTLAEQVIAAHPHLNFTGYELIERYEVL